MANKKVTKKEIKENIIEIFDIENRPLNIKEVTEILKKEYGILRSQPIIRKYLDELAKEKELYLYD